MMQVTDIPFDRALDVNSIQYRIAPIDIGFDVRTQGMRIAVRPSDDPIRISYARKTGERYVIEGPQPAVLRKLRGHGYRFAEEAAS